MDEQAPPMNVAWLLNAPDEVNLASYATDDQLAELSRLVEAEYDIDAASCEVWRKAMEKGLELAGTMARAERTLPFPAASDVRFPLVATAAITFNAQAYPSIVPPGDVVKVATVGRDPSGAKAAVARRVAEHMSYQLRRKIPEWEEETDRLAMQLPIVGLMFRKVYHDATKARPVVKLCGAGKVIVNANVKALEEAPRISEEIALYPSEVIGRQRSGVFTDGDWWQEGQADSQEPILFIEQHRPYDMDGDGYPEPYVVTQHKDSGEIVRIAANWRPEDVVATDRVLHIQRRDYYQDYHFLPNPAGGFHSIGFGLLLGDISESINSALNMMFDAEHFAALPGGFLGKEARLKGGRHRMEPGRWEQIAASGQDLRSAMVQITTPGASATMFSLLGLLIDAGRELANVKDISAIAQRANMPATTTIALIEQGMQATTAIYQRIHRSLSSEFGMIARINVDNLSPQEYARFFDAPADPQADYMAVGDDIEPVADPRALSSPQKMAKAQFLFDLAQAGLVNPQVAMARMMEAASIPDTEELMPEPDPAMQEMQGMERQVAESSMRRAMLENVKLGLELQKIEAEIALEEADAIKTMAEAEAADPMNPLNVARIQIEALKARIQSDARGLGRMANAPANSGGVGGSVGGGAGTQGVDLGELLANGGGPAQGMGGVSGV